MLEKKISKPKRMPFVSWSTILKGESTAKRIVDNKGNPIGWAVAGFADTPAPAIIDILKRSTVTKPEEKVGDDTEPPVPPNLDY